MALYHSQIHPATLQGLVGAIPDPLTIQKESVEYFATDTNETFISVIAGGVMTWVLQARGGSGSGGPSAADAVTGIVTTVAGNPYTPLLRVNAGLPVTASIVVPQGGGFVLVSLMGSCVVPQNNPLGAVYFQILVGGVPVVRTERYFPGTTVALGGVGFRWMAIAIEDRVAVAAGPLAVTAQWKSDVVTATIDPDPSTFLTNMVLLAEFSPS